MSRRAHIQTREVVHVGYRGIVIDRATRERRFEGPIRQRPDDADRDTAEWLDVPGALRFGEPIYVPAVFPY